MTMSVDTAKMYWINANYGGNTLGITDAQLKEIEEQYGGQLANWKLEAESTDVTEIYVDDWTEGQDSEIEEILADGRRRILENPDLSEEEKQARLAKLDEIEADYKENGRSGISGWQVAGTTVSGVSSFGNLITSIVNPNIFNLGSGKIASLAGGKSASVIAANADKVSAKAIENVSAEAFKEGGEELLIQTGDDAYEKFMKGSWRVTAPMALANYGIGALNVLNNLKLVEALELLKDVLDTQGQDALQNVIAQLDAMDKEVADAIKKAEEARANFDGDTSTIGGQLTEKEIQLLEAEAELKQKESEKLKIELLVKVLQGSIEALEGKESLTPEETFALEGYYADLADYNARLSVLIPEIDVLRIKVTETLPAEIEGLKTQLGETKSSGQSELEAENENVKSKSDQFGELVNDLGQQQAVVNDIASSDTETMVMAITEAVSQTGNAVSGGVAGVQATKVAALATGVGAFAAAAYPIACAVMGFTAAIGSAANAVMQAIFASRVNDVIDTRKNFQAQIDEKLGLIDDSYANYDTSVDYIAELNALDVETEESADA